MTIFNDLFDWAEAEPRPNQVLVHMGAVYDKANPERVFTPGRYSDFAAVTGGELRLEDDLLTARVLVTFSNRLIWIDNQTWETGQRDTWGSAAAARRQYRSRATPLEN